MGSWGVRTGRVELGPAGARQQLEQATRPTRTKIPAPAQKKQQWHTVVRDAKQNRKRAIPVYRGTYATQFTVTDKKYSKKYTSVYIYARPEALSLLLAGAQPSSPREVHRRFTGQTTWNYSGTCIAVVKSGNADVGVRRGVKAVRHTLRAQNIIFAFVRFNSRVTSIGAQRSRARSTHHNTDHSTSPSTAKQFLSSCGAQQMVSRRKISSRPCFENETSAAESTNSTVGTAPNFSEAPHYYNMWVKFYTPPNNRPREVLQISQA